MNAGEVGTTIQIKAPIFAPPSPLIFTDLLLGFASYSSVFPPAAISLMNPDAGFNICTSMTNWPSTYPFFVLCSKILISWCRRWFGLIVWLFRLVHSLQSLDGENLTLSFFLTDIKSRSSSHTLKKYFQKQTFHLCLEKEDASDLLSAQKEDISILSRTNIRHKCLQIDIGVLRFVSKSSLLRDAG